MGVVSPVDKMKFRLLICTANIGNAVPDSESLKAWIPDDGDVVDVVFGPNYEFLKGKKPELGRFDLIVVGMQESGCTLRDSDILENSPDSKDFSHRKSIQTGKLKGSIEKVNNIVSGHKDFIGSKDSISTLVSRQCPSFEIIVNIILGEIRLIILVKKTMKQYISQVEGCSQPTGMGNVLANKGGVIATLTFRSTRLSFISAHLAAHEGEPFFTERCNNLQSILAKSRTMKNSNGFDVALSSHHCFLFGDLNFRLKSDPDATPEQSMKEILDLVSSSNWDKLLQKDELNEAIKNQLCLYNFKNPLCMFPPTFKVRRSQGILYNSQRTPSYTDRILWISSDTLENDVKLLSYDSCPNYTTSDHKPIRGSFLITGIGAPPTSEKWRLSKLLKSSSSSRKNFGSFGSLGSYGSFRKSSRVSRVNAFISDVNCTINSAYSSFNNIFLKVEITPSNIMEKARTLKLKNNNNESHTSWESGEDEITFPLSRTGDELRGALIFLTIIGKNGSYQSNETKASKVIGTTVLSLYEMQKPKSATEDWKEEDFASIIHEHSFEKILTMNSKVRGAITFSAAIWQKEKSAKMILASRSHKQKKKKQSRSARYSFAAFAKSF